jgi:hypothetical protein
MKCDKCGYCCVYYDVVVPIKPDEPLAEGNATHKPGGKRCHHNLPDGTCAIHDKPWYKDLSCHSYDYGDDSLCEITPGPATASQLVKRAPVHDPNVPGAFTQDVLMMINAELVQKNKAAKSRRENKDDSARPIYDPKSDR